MTEGCIAGVAQRAGVSMQDAADLVGAVDDHAGTLVSGRGMSRAAAVRQAAQELSDREFEAADRKRAQAIENLRKRRETDARIDAKANELHKNGNPDLVKALRNELVAIFTPTKGGRFSAEAQTKARSHEYMGSLLVQLKKSGLLKAARDRGMERDVAREMYELSLKAAGDTRAQPGVTKNAAAAGVADTYHGLLTTSRERLNAVGANIGKYTGYVTRTVHDPDKIRRAGYEAWKEFIQARLDPRTFEGVANKDGFLKEQFGSFVSGNHLVEGAGYQDPLISAPSANVADKAAASRALHFKDGDTWYDYQSKFGRGTLLDQVSSSLQRSARQETLLDRFGTNPRSEYEAHIKRLADRYTEESPEAVRDLMSSKGALMKLFDHLDGTASRPANQMAADIGASLRSLESLSKLGTVAFAHLSSGVTKAAELRYHGVGLLDSYGNFVSSILQGRGKGEVRELSDLLLAGTEGMQGHLMSQFQADDSKPGMMSKAMTTFFRLNGLTYLLDAQKAGAERIMSRHFGALMDTGWEHLPEASRRTLSLYDISPNEWNALRTADGHPTVDGREHLTPDAAHRADVTMMENAHESVASLTRESVERHRDQLALNVHAMFSDIADRGIVTPGIAERSMMTQGTAPGSLVGEAMRFVSQFKMWGVAATRQGIGREIYGGQGTAGALSGLAHMAVGGTIMGYLVSSLKALSKGETPPDPGHAATWAEAAMKGGSFGVMADYLFGSFDRQHPLAESLAGPVLGQDASDVANLFNDMKSGKGWGKAPADTMRMLEAHIPGGNMFYVKAALDYMILHSVNESLNPGYLARMQKSVRARGGDYWLSPQNHLHTFGR